MIGEVPVTPAKKLDDLLRLSNLCVDLLRQNEEFYAEVRSRIHVNVSQLIWCPCQTPKSSVGFFVLITKKGKKNFFHPQLTPTFGPRFLLAFDVFSLFEFRCLSFTSFPLAIIISLIYYPTLFLHLRNGTIHPFEREHSHHRPLGIPYAATTNTVDYYID